MFQAKCEFSRGCLMNSRGAKRRVASGAKAQFFLGLNVGAEAPTTVATIYEAASSYAKHAGGIALALALVVLIFGGFAASSPKPGGRALPAAPKKDDTSSQVYQHTYDEVFQASLEAIERLGLFVAAQDKDKGTVSGNGAYRMQCVAGPCDMNVTFGIRIQTVSTKPETRVTIDATRHGMTGHGEGITQFKNAFLRAVQQVLSTYH
jgi:hypothetical protein